MLAFSSFDEEVDGRGLGDEPRIRGGDFALWGVGDDERIGASCDPVEPLGGDLS